ncbi:MAG: hypothetical protein LBF40_11285 [Deltaproteobacteria bacterium]|jgi:hypothetical protein|nr:hypothetical protein [Deltaproteobacteria bacterium]
MALLQLALIVSARRELILSAGEVRKGERDGTSFELTDEPIQTLDGPAFLKVGLAQTGSINVSGAEVVNMDYPGDSLGISWYIPAEESPDDARPVDLGKVGVIPTELPREAPEPGHVWHFRVDGRGPFTETLFYDSGFLPPFKPTDVTLRLTDIGNFGFKTLVLTQVIFGHKAPTYTEGDWGLSETIAQGFLGE